MRAEPDAGPLARSHADRPGSRPMSVTIKDVARLAGVSVATVSRVLNGSAPVQDDTRDRVLAVAGELHFSPNRAARSLSMQRTQAIGVILPDLYGEFFSELLAWHGSGGAARAATRCSSRARTTTRAASKRPSASCAAESTGCS